MAPNVYNIPNLTYCNYYYLFSEIILNYEKFDMMEVKKFYVTNIDLKNKNDQNKLKCFIKKEVNIHLYPKIN